jgi:predicted dehydrogenase
MSELRCGVIGAGTMGEQYGRAFDQLPAARLSAVVDRDHERGRTFAACFGLDDVFTDVEELLSAEVVDAVALALPDFDHRKAAVACLDAGVHVLCEKPLATTREDCRAIVAAADRSEASLMVNYANRHRPAARMLREAIHSGRFGELQSISIKGHEPWTKTATLHWRNRTDPTWFLVSHLVDMVGWLTGRSLTSVRGRAAYGCPGGLKLDPSVPTSVTYLAEIEGGGHAILSSSWIMPETFTPGGDFSIELIGTEGAAAVDFTESGMRFYDIQAPSEPNWDWDQADFDGWRPGWWFTSTRYFIHCICGGREPSPGPYEGMQVSAVLAAMSRALQEDGVIRVPPWEVAE